MIKKRKRDNTSSENIRPPTFSLHLLGVISWISLAEAGGDEVAVHEQGDEEGDGHRGGSS